MAKVEFHPYFAGQYEGLCQISGAEDLAGEVTSLLDALASHGHDLEGHEPDDPSHPVLSSKVAMFALRRTPPTIHTPYAVEAPVLRIPYVWFNDSDGTELAVVMLVGDKTELGNDWYETNVKKIETTLIPEWSRENPTHRPQRRWHR